MTWWNVSFRIRWGVGVPKVAEIISHAVLAWTAHAKADESLILVDFSNAYNSRGRGPQF